MRTQADPFTVKDVEVHFGKHYLTSYRWIKQLQAEGFVELYPMRRGRADQYVLVEGSLEAAAPGVANDAGARALRVACGNEQLTVAAWACRNLETSAIPAIAHGLLYLYARSYYAGVPDHEHLRGPVPAVDVRAFIAQQLAALKRDLSAIEQLMSFKQPWEETDALAQRFGDFPPGVTMTVVLERAHLFLEKAMKIGPQPGEEATVDVPELAPAPVVQPTTLGDALEAMKPQS